MTDDARVLVLMPVFNGAQFLGSQLDSILGQQQTRVMILCRDDGSTDGSTAILQEYAAHFPGQVLPVTDSNGNLGASGNFSLLMQAALDFSAAWDYVALADQDDIWYPEKLRRCVDAISSEGDTPTLVHSDLRVVAADGAEVAPSLIRYQGLEPGRETLSWQLLSNNVTGCTALMNRALLECALPVPPAAVMHDWWLSLVATITGRRIFLDEVLIDYRQHGSNTLGAQQWKQSGMGWNVLSRLMDNQRRELLMRTAEQASTLGQRFRGELSLWQRLAVWSVGWLALPLVPLQKLLFRLLRRMPV